LHRAIYRPRADARFRTISETKILDMLLLECWAVDGTSPRQARAITSDSFEGWIANGLGFHTAPDGRRLFDPVEVINFMKWSGLTGQDRFWTDHYVEAWRARVLRGRSEKSSEARPPQTVRVKFTRTFDLHSFPRDAKVRLRVPVPLAGDQVRDLEIHPITALDTESVATLRESCLEVRMSGISDSIVTIGVDCSMVVFVRPSHGPPLAAGDRDLYLRPDEGLIRVTPRVAALAEKLDGKRDPHEAVSAFWFYMLDSFICGAVRYNEVLAQTCGDWVLDNGWFDCQLGSALLASLCRSRGIPARIVSGHFLYRDAPTHHYWAEVWFDDAGWTPFDLLSWDLSQAGRDLEWRSVFAGQVDDRIITQRLPLTFTGAMSVRLPPAWQMLQTRAKHGIDITYSDPIDGSLIYQDHIEVENGGPT